MRYFAPLATLLVAALTVVPAYAQMDLDSLLGELTYGGSQLVNETDDGVEADLLPLPNAETGLLDSTNAAADSSAGAAKLPVNPGPPLPDKMLGERLKSRPAPTVTSPSAVPPSANMGSTSSPLPPANVNFQSMFDQQHAYPTDVSMASSHQSDCGCQSCAGHNHRSVAVHGHASGHARQRLIGHHRSDGACDSPYECRPHVRPNLPPPSSFIQQFHSRNANSNLWAGYAKEAQKRDDFYYKHVRGECDCLSKTSRKSCLHYSPPVYRAAAVPKACSSCKSCDAGGCDGHHH